MISESRKINQLFRTMSNSYSITVNSNISYKNIMKNNSSRLEFLNKLLEDAINNELSQDLLEILDNNIDFIYSFMNGDFSAEIKVPERFFSDMEECAIIPSERDLDYLFYLIETNIDIYNKLYDNKNIVLTLPNMSFNMNMARVLEIKKRNLPHLMGLTESDLKNNASSNLLMKYFVDHIKNRSKYGKTIIEQFLNWIISDEGKSEIKRLNKITIDFVSSDRKAFPKSYDEQGNIKDIDKFKKRFKQKLGLEFPIIKYSRYITKCINNINYMNLFNVEHMILDYNAPRDKKSGELLEKDEKDILIINAKIEKLIEKAKVYCELFDNIIKMLSLYDDTNKNNPNNAYIENSLKRIGINVQEKDILSYINLIKTHNFVGKHGIVPDNYGVITKISDKIGNFFKRDIHVIGFDTEFSKAPGNNSKIVDLNDFSLNYAHCDTSISIKISDLINKYYRRGRAFFIDKIQDSNAEIIRLANPIEEINYYDFSFLLGINHDGNINQLKKNFELFNSLYYAYKNRLKKKR